MNDDWGVRAARWAGIRSDHIQLGSTRVHALRAGDDVDGPRQLFVHGLGGSASNWLDVLPALAQRGPVLAPDLPGFGRTEPPVERATRVGANARFLAALLDRVGWDEVELHGNSMGGMLSVLFAARERERIAALVLVSPALTSSRRDIPQLPRATLVRFAPFFVPSLGRHLLRQAYERMTPEQLYQDTAAFIHADPDRVSPELSEISVENVRYGRETPWRLPGFALATTSVVWAVTARQPLERAIHEVAAPTLVVWGDRDRLIGRPVIDRALSLRPDWELAELSGVGHAAMIETPERYLEMVVPWLDGRRSGVVTAEDAGTAAAVSDRP